MKSILEIPKDLLIDEMMEKCKCLEDNKRTYEENEVRKNSIEGSYDMALQQTTNYRRYK